MITLENIKIHELVGLKTMISDSPNKQIIGLYGTIVDETKFMFIINTKKGFKMIPKKQLYYKKNYQFILVNSKDTPEVKVQFMLTNPHVLMLKKVIQF